MSFTPSLVGVGAVFMDDIVKPTGQTHMGILGGGVVHALMGAALWDERPGIHAVSGQGLPEEIQRRLEAHLDTQGLRQLPILQMRSWQVFEHDGKRTEVYRVHEVEPFLLGAQAADLPAAYHGSAAFYLLQGFEGILTWCDYLQRTSAQWVLFEPLQQFMVAGVRPHIQAALRTGRVDILSPNLLEAQTVYELTEADALIEAMLGDGVRVVALRMGEQGSLLADKHTGERCWIPAVPVSALVDQTGAGNTYCGALVRGLMRGLSLREAGAQAAVSASFCLEEIGAMNPARVTRNERDRRLAWAINNAR